MALGKVMDRVNRWYDQYIIMSNVYFLEPIERWIINTLLFFFLALVIYTTCVYLPGHSVMMLHFFKYLLGLEPEADIDVAI